MASFWGLLCFNAFSKEVTFTGDAATWIVLFEVVDVVEETSWRGLATEQAARPVAKDTASSERAKRVALSDHTATLSLRKSTNILNIPHLLSDRRYLRTVGNQYRAIELTNTLLADT